jgi:hypothetical protein
VLFRSRRQPDGTDLLWKQVGVKELLSAPQLPFFIEWSSDLHPSQSGKATAKISQIVFANENPLDQSAFGPLISNALSSGEISLSSITTDQLNSGILQVEFVTQAQKVIID